MMTTLPDSHSFDHSIVSSSIVRLHTQALTASTFVVFLFVRMRCIFACIVEITFFSPISEG